MKTITQSLDAIVKVEIARRVDAGSSRKWAFGDEARAIYDECLSRFEHEDIMARAMAKYKTYFSGPSYDMLIARRCMMFIINDLRPKPEPEEEEKIPEGKEKCEACNSTGRIKCPGIRTFHCDNPEGTIKHPRCGGTGYWKPSWIRKCGRACQNVYRRRRR